MNYTEKATSYARDVTNGTIPACWQIRRACEIFLTRLADPGDRYYYSEEKAHKVCTVIEAFPHSKGKWANKRELIRLEPWQCFFLCNVFGWLRVKDNTRQYREAFLLVPRKSGKSAIAAGIGLYMFAADGEYGAEVYSGATTEKQAWEVFRPAKIMAQRVPLFRSHFGVDVNAKNLHRMEDGSRFEPLIGKPGDGSSPHCAIVDEVHEHPDSSLIDTMITGMGAREQPLMLYISTAGDNIAGPCYAMQREAERVLEGSAENDQLFALIYTIDQDDDPLTIEALIKANPNYGVSISEDFLQARLQDAKNNARKQATFMTKHLNVWVGSRQAYFDVRKWLQCASPDLDIDTLRGKRCILALDLASRVDIAALEILFPHGDGTYTRFGRYYLPEETILKSENEHYQGWVRDGRIIETEGEIIDFERIRDDIVELCAMFDVQEVAYDPFQATMLVTELMKQGIPVVEVKATVNNFSEPMKELDALIKAKRLAHDDDPVMTWMISNVVAKEDAKENVYPRKEKDENKIDGVVALIMALGRAMTYTAPKKSIYSQGVI